MGEHQVKPRFLENNSSNLVMDESVIASLAKLAIKMDKTLQINCQRFWLFMVKKGAMEHFASKS